MKLFQQRSNCPISVAACVTANVPPIEVLSNEVLPAIVVLSNKYGSSVTVRCIRIEVLSNEVVPATVKLSDNRRQPVSQLMYH